MGHRSRRRLRRRAHEHEQGHVQNDLFFADLHRAFDRLEGEFNELSVVLTGQRDTFSAGIDFQYSFEIFGSGSHDKIREWYRTYRETNLRIFQYPRPTVAAINGHAIAGGLITALDCDSRVAARKDAKFGLNEVPIGIPMPAAYVEIIKYALGDQVGALTTLRGELYGLEQADRLGFFHEVVSPTSSCRQPSGARAASPRIATPPTPCPRRRCKTA